jgi:hypothetical protein
LYASLYIIRVIKSRTRWTGHVAHMSEMRNAYKVLVGKLERKRPIGVNLGIDVSIILEWILGK